MEVLINTHLYLSQGLEKKKPKLCLSVASEWR